MRAFILALLVTFGLIQFVYSQDSLFRAGNRAFTDGFYEKAIEHYQEVLSQGYHSPELYYNLGLAQHSANYLAQAILSFERALKIDASHEASRLALAQVRQNIEIPVTKIQNFVLWDWYVSLLNLFSSNHWALIEITFGVAILVLVYWLLFRNPMNKRLFIFLIGLCLVAFAGTWYASYQKRLLEKGGEAAILTIQRSYVMSAPDGRSEVVTEISEGTKVFILDQIGEWYKIQLEDKDVGWVEMKKVEII